jgi:recombinase-like zinc beta ribbon protein
MTIPVPALVEPEVLAAVQEQWQENKRHARQSRRGALYLLQGLLQCQHCGYAFYGKRLSPSARKGKPRASAYYRCLGTDAYRCGGERLCQNTQVRPDLLDLAVWQEVGTLLPHPERLAEEYRRRLQPETRTNRTPLATIEDQISKGRQGLARLIDSYAESLIDKAAFEPRITRLRQRLARLEEQRQALAEEAALRGELQLIIGRLEDFAAKLHDGLETADWASQRDLIRALGKRVEVAHNEVNVVFRIDPYPSDHDPEKKVCNFVGGETLPPRGWGRQGLTGPLPAEGAPSCGLTEGGEEGTAEKPTEDAYREEESWGAWDPGRAIHREPAGRDQAMEVGVMVQGLSPSMQHAQKADLRSQLLGIPCNRLERLRDGLKEQGRDLARILEGEGAERGGEGKDDMAVGLMCRSA